MKFLIKKILRILRSFLEFLIRVKNILKFNLLPRPEKDKTTTKQRLDRDQTKIRPLPYTDQTETRQRSDRDQTKTIPNGN